MSRRPGALAILLGAATTHRTCRSASDNGPEFVCAAIADCARNKVSLAFISPGTTWNNGYVDSFHACQRDECLNINSFFFVLHAKVLVAGWNHE